MGYHPQSTNSLERCWSHPSHADDIYLGWAKAFGILASLLFLSYYIGCYEPENFTLSPLYCFCDNAGMLTNIPTMISSTILRPNDTTNDGRDVYLAMSNALTKCNLL